MNLNAVILAVILVLLGATKVESKFVPSPYATINDNRGSTAVAPSPYATINDNRGSTAVVKRKLSKKNKYVSQEHYRFKEIAKYLVSHNIETTVVVSN